MSSEPRPRAPRVWHEIRIILKRGRQVWRLIARRHQFALLGAGLIMALTSVVGTAIPLFLGDLVDRVKLATDQGLRPGEVYRSAAFFLTLIGGAFLLREALNVGRRYLVENTSTRIDRDMTIRLVSHLIKVDLSTLSKEKVGSLHGRILRSVDGFVRFVRLGFLTFLPALLTGLFALGATVWKQPWVGLAMLGVIPTSIVLTVWQLMSQKGVRLKLLRSKEEMDGTVVEQLGGLDYVRAANTHRLEITRVARSAERRRHKEVRHHFQMSLFGCAKALNEGFFHILVLALAIYLAVHARISFGDILTFSMLFLGVMTPLSEVHRVIDEGHECSLQVGDLIALLAEPVDRSFYPPGERAPCVDGTCPLIVVENLQMEYQTADGRTRRVLDGLALAVRKGEHIGIAGRSGCGKSTWLKILLRLTHPTGGSLELGGVPLDLVTREALGNLVGYVGQTPFVFSGTIADNIAYGVEGATAENIRRAAELACIHDDIMAMPGDYQAAVAERGQNLSGGQRQRLALARLFLKNPPILILDEATSALDNISERSVQRALATTHADRTLIVVAHRLSTLRDADRILVFDEGRVVETGTYQELLESKGVFAELIRSAQEGQGVAAQEVAAGAETPPATPSKPPVTLPGVVAGDPALALATS